MKIMSIETSCDETGVSIIEGRAAVLTVLGNALASQTELHATYGGVFPAMAKRAHAEKIIPLLTEALTEAGLLVQKHAPIPDTIKKQIIDMCSHESGLAEQIISFVETYAIPEIDQIAVTAGPGLEPALWVGINTATALGLLWNKPVYPINHMEGHVVSALFEQKTERTFAVQKVQYPALALLVSGGHTELVLITESLTYKKIGHTKDDAIGEAFDKVARILGLPYPGGPKISALAQQARAADIPRYVSLPRPMLHSGTYDFSYSGLKTAVLYAVKNKKLTDSQKKSIAREFEEAAIEVLIKKTKDAISAYDIQTLIVSGGVSANDYLRNELAKQIPIPILFPKKELSTDNSIMIGMASYYQSLYENKKSAIRDIKADGNLSL